MAEEARAVNPELKLRVFSEAHHPGECRRVPRRRGCLRRRHRLLRHRRPPACIPRGAAARDLGHHRRADRLQCRLAGLLPDGHEFRRVLRPQGHDGPGRSARCVPRRAYPPSDPARLPGPDPGGSAGPARDRPRGWRAIFAAAWWRPRSSRSSWVGPRSGRHPGISSSTPIAKGSARDASWEGIVTPGNV